ncbi:MAG: hypothetical protein GY776_00005, partial [Alteromonas sp.]|nr:hypothetical protein [Alteromonas sp.]
MQDTMVYDAMGNITRKSDVGDYTYNAVQPNAVSDITGNDGFTAINQNQDIVYNHYNKFTEFTQTDKKLTVTYGLDGMRRKTRFTKNNELQKEKLFLGGLYEREMQADSTFKELFYISGPTGLAAIRQKQSGTDSLFYVHTDFLGSLDKLTNEDGVVVESRSYDAWGRRRNPNTWTTDNVPAMKVTDRGYTMHEHLDELNIINMNGRIYDPVIARFLSPDPFIQAPDFTQNFNSYSYVLNNPLKYTDPSGYSFTRPQPVGRGRTDRYDR